MLNKLCSVGVGGSVLFVLTSMSKHRNHCLRKTANVVSGVPHGSVLGQLLFLLYSSDHFSILQNKLIANADDSTLIAVVPSKDVRVTVVESLNRDLGKVIKWCDLRGMKLNASMTKTMIVSRSCTMHFQSPALTIGSTVLKHLMTLRFYTNLTFDKHLCSVSTAAHQRLDILEPRLVRDLESLLERCFRVL